MPLSDGLKTGVGLSVVFSLGGGLFLLHVIHALGEGENLRTFLSGILIPTGFTIGLLAAGGWLWYADLEGPHVLRIAGWCLVGASALAIGTALTIFYQQAEGVVMGDRLFVVAGQASIGSVVGFVVGIYDVRQRTARAHAEQLSHQLTVLNRVLRHDIRNGANIIRGHAELLTDSGDRDRNAEAIRKQAADLVELGDHARAVERLLHEEGTGRRSVDIASIIGTHLERITRTNPEVDVETSLHDTERVVAHPLIESAVANILENAIEHNDKERPRIEVTGSRFHESGTEYVRIEIADNGPGIPNREIEVLERGYETPLEHVSGFGLWLVNWIVTESDGEVRFEQNTPTGCVVSLKLERANETDESHANEPVSTD